MQVLPGSRVPADGEVMAGQSFVDESMLTGESAPVSKAPGAHVISGTVNQVCILATSQPPPPHTSAATEPDLWTLRYFA